MSEGPDRDLVDAGLGDRADVLERDAARGLEASAAASERDRGSQLVGAHVVEQDRLGSRGERLRHLLERVALDLDREWRGSAQPLDRARDRARGPEVVVLDEDPVVEAETVVPTAARRDRMLLERTEPG